MNTHLKPLVSVVMPAFNAAAVIAETLDSLLAQTFKDFEAIIVDDGSTDTTVSIVQNFCERDSRLRLLRRPHVGLPATRNAGIAATNGEFIAFLDADDIWLPKKLERQLALVQEDPRANFLFANYYIWDGKRDLSTYYHSNHALPEGDVARALVFANIFGTSTVLIKRALLQQAGGFDPARNVSEDWDMWLRLVEHGLWVSGTREPLARYRRWPESVSNYKEKIMTHNVQLLKKHLHSTRRTELRPLYQRSLAHACGRLELAQARLLIETQPVKIPAAVWRAWRIYPRRFKWLMWFALVAWPKYLGGRFTEKIVHRELVEKF